MANTTLASQFSSAQVKFGVSHWDGQVYVNSYGLFPLSDSDSDSDSNTDSCSMQILWDRDQSQNLSQWEHVLQNTM